MVDVGRSVRDVARARVPAKLSVLMTADAVGGVWAYALELAASLLSDGGDGHDSR